MKTREDKIMSMKSRDNSLAFRDHAHFFLDERLLFNCSENANETSFKKLTVMEKLNVTMISKKKRNYFTHLNLVGEEGGNEQRNEIADN